MPTPHRSNLKLALAVALSALAGYPEGPAPAEAKPAKHRPKKPRITADPDWGSAPSARYGALGKTACIAELKRRKIAFVEVDEARGVLAPVRLTAPLAGVAYHTDAPLADRAKSPHAMLADSNVKPFEILDCRLALALHDLGPVLVKFGVAEAIMFSAWRPPAKSWPADQPATRHPGGLAIDLRRLVLKAPVAVVAGATSEKTAAKPRNDLVVDRDWTPARDKAPCGGAVRPDSAEARALRAIFCEAADQRLFTTMLSPNYNNAHENHFHLEITPGVTWRLVL